MRMGKWKGVRENIFQDSLQIQLSKLTNKYRHNKTNRKDKPFADSSSVFGFSIAPGMIFKKMIFF